MGWLWGHTGISLIDYWTLSHLAFWLVFGSTICAMKLQRRWAFIAAMFVALGWELFERYAEKQWPNVWQSTESWLNAWVSDPLTCIAAFLVACYGFDKWRPK